MADIQIGLAQRKPCGCMVQWVSPLAGSHLTERLAAWLALGDEAVSCTSAAFEAQLDKATACDHNRGDTIDGR